MHRSLEQEQAPATPTPAAALYLQSPERASVAGTFVGTPRKRTSTLEVPDEERLTQHNGSAPTTELPVAGERSSFVATENDGRQSVRKADRQCPL